jgi:hypothetical protein
VKLFSARRISALLVVVLAYYLLVVGHRAVVLVRDGRWAFRGLGVGLLLLAVVGVVLVVAEVRFGVATQRLARAADDDTGDTGDPGDFDAAAAAAEAAPDDWRSWYRLALAYDAGRDPRRGRAAMRRAIAVERATRG